MDGAVALPEEDAAGCEALGGLTTLQSPRIPDHHVFHGNSHGGTGVAAEVLIGQEEDALSTPTTRTFHWGPRLSTPTTKTCRWGPRVAASEGPFKCRARVGGGADQAAALAAECLDGGCRIHIGQGNGFGGESKALEGFPAGLDLGDFSHVGHGAASVQVGQNDLLAVAAKYVGAFGHKVYAAEDDVFGVGFGCCFG